jgi:hypothetical protein
MALARSCIRALAPRRGLRKDFFSLGCRLPPIGLLRGITENRVPGPSMSAPARLVQSSVRSSLTHIQPSAIGVSPTTAHQTGPVSNIPNHLQSTVRSLSATDWTRLPHRSGLAVSHPQSAFQSSPRSRLVQSHPRPPTRSQQLDIDHFDLHSRDCAITERLCYDGRHRSRYPCPNTRT